MQVPISCSGEGKQKVLANLTWQSLFSLWSRSKGMSQHEVREDGGNRAGPASKSHCGN